MPGPDPARHRRQQGGRAWARLVVQQASLQLRAGAELPELLQRRLPRAASLLEHHHGSTVPAAVKQLLMGWSWTDEGESRQPSGNGSKPEAGKGKGGGKRGGRKGGAETEPGIKYWTREAKRERNLDSSGLPSVGKSKAYIVCGKCNAWYHCYGVTTAYCSCGNRFSKGAIGAAKAAGAVIAGTWPSSYKEALASAPRDGSGGNGSDGTRIQPGSSSVFESASERKVP